MAQIALARTAGDTADPAFRRDILEGLSRSPKSTPARWFYDKRGSELFEQITKLPEYYPTRIETELLQTYCRKVAAIVGPGRAVVEFGAGSVTKTPHLLKEIAPAAYVAMDISGDFLRESTDTLARDFPNIPICAVEADFTRSAALPKMLDGLPRLGFFPGSTIGNFEPAAAVDLLRSFRRSLGEGAMLLIGVDRIKEPKVLIPAYDDAAGITAQFNLNLLVRINRELNGTIPLGAFRHIVHWQDNAARIEMHLAARRDVDFTVAGTRFTMRAGETIHTENSHKYGERDTRLLLRAGGWTPVKEWTDPDRMFAMILAGTSPI